MANGFKFSLEKLLEMRKTREEEGKKLFNNSQQELQKSINKLNDLNDKYKQYNGIAAGETVIYQKLKKNYLIALNKGIEQTEIEIEKKQKEVDYRREQLKVRQIERKTVDILREKGLSKAAKKADRIAAEGLVAIEINEDNTVASICSYEKDWKGGERTWI